MSDYLIQRKGFEQRLKAIDRIMFFQGHPFTSAH